MEHAQARIRVCGRFSAMFDAFEAAAARDVLRIMLAQAVASRPADCSGCKCGAGLTQIELFGYCRNRLLCQISCFKLHFGRSAALEGAAKAPLGIAWSCDLLADSPAVAVGFETA